MEKRNEISELLAANPKDTPVVIDYNGEEQKWTIMIVHPQEGEDHAVKGAIVKTYPKDGLTNAIDYWLGLSDAMRLFTPDEEEFVPCKVGDLALTAAAISEVQNQVLQHSETPEENQVSER